MLFTYIWFMEIRNNFLFINGKQVPYRASPNRGGVIVPLYLIEHYTADNSPEQSISWLLNPASKVSAHLVCDRDGKFTQLVPFNIKAQHAGESRWGSIVGLNSHSIGIEITNMGRSSVPKPGYIKLTHKNETKPAYWQEYTPAQIAAVKEVSALLVLHYGLKDVLGHDDIAPGRKSDPGPAFPLDEMKPSGMKQKVTATDLNLRVGAGTGFEKISTLPKDTHVTVLGEDGNWVKVFVINSKLTGWVSGAYLK